MVRDAGGELGREGRARLWADRARAWRESGQTQVAYCAEHGLSVGLLRKWIVKLGAKKARMGRRPTLLPIALRPAGTPVIANEAVAREAALEIALPNGARIRASGRIADQLTRSIARALRC